MYLAVLGLVLGVGCTSAPQTCAFDTALQAQLAPGVYGDCGDVDYEQFLNPPPDPTPFRAVHDCLVSAAAAQQPVVGRHGYAIIDGSTTTGFGGTVMAGSYQLFQVVYQRAALNGETESVTVSTCASLDDLGADCPNMLENLCLACARPVTVSTCQQSSPI